MSLLLNMPDLCLTVECWLEDEELSSGKAIQYKLHHFGGKSSSAKYQYSIILLYGSCVFRFSVFVINYAGCLAT